jgi:hypothetical protein
MNLVSRLLSPLFFVFGAATAQGLDYSRAIHLDAEALAEQGMVDCYSRLLPELKAYVAAPLVVSEKVDTERGRYAVLAGGSVQEIFPSPLGGDQHESWGVATAALFEFVKPPVEKCAGKVLRNQQRQRSDGNIFNSGTSGGCTQDA